MKAWIARDERGVLTLHGVKPEYWEEDDWDGQRRYWCCPNMTLPKESYPGVTFEKSPVEVEIVLKKALEAHYRDISHYEDLVEMVTQMRKAQKEANDLIAQVECYEEAMEHIKKAEELEQMVDKWLEGEAL